MENIPLPNSDGHRYQSTMPNNTTSYRVNGVTKSNNLVLGKVISVDYQRGLAQVVTENSIFTSVVKATQGALMPVDFFNTNSKGEVYGNYRPIETGSVVLLGYLDGNTANPIVIGVYPPVPEAMEKITPTPINNISDQTYPTRNEVLTFKTVYPSQQVKLITERGDYFRTFNGRSLLVVDQDNFGKLSDISYDAFSDMRARHANEKQDLYDVPNEAQRMLLLHQANTDTDKHRTRFFIDRNGDASAYWLDANNDKSLVGVQATKDKGIKVFYNHVSQTVDASSLYSSIEVTSDNKITLQSNDKDGKGSVVITPQGTSIDGFLVASESNFESLSTRFQTLQQRFDTLKTEIDKVGVDYIVSLPDKIASLNRDIGTVENGLNILKKTTSDMTLDLTVLKNNYKTLTQDVDTSTKDFNNKISNLQGRLSNYESVVDDVATLKNKLLDLNNSVQEYEKNKDSYLTSNSQVVQSLVQDLQNSKTTVADLTSQLKTANTTINDLVTQLKAANTNIDALTQRVTALENKK